MVLQEAIQLPIFWIASSPAVPRNDRLKSNFQISWIYIMKQKTFHWEGVNQQQQFCSGNILARNIISARVKLQQQAITIKKLQPDSILFHLFNPTALNKKEVMHFTRQLTTLLTAGIPLTQALTMLYNGHKFRTLKKVCYRLKIQIENGISFTEALRQQSSSFDELFCSLVNAGEHSGTLEIMLERLANYYETTEKLKNKVRKALTYPGAIIVVAILVSAILLFKVIPVFATLFNSSGHHLPRFTQWVINLSQFCRHYGLGIAISMIATPFLWQQARKHSSYWRQKTDLWLIKLPLVGTLLRKTILARFCRTLATTFAAGMPLLTALQLAANTTNNLFYHNAISQLCIHVNRGEALHTSMAAQSAFPDMLLIMTSIGEESGKVEQMINRAATIYEEEVEHLISNLSSLLEPAIMSILGLLIGALVIAMYLPIFKIGQVF